MTTINKQIAASADDCYETDDSSCYTDGEDVYCGNSSEVYDIGLRWQSVNIAQGATISVATLSLYLVGDYGTLYANIRAVNEDNAAQWSSSNRPSQQSKTGTVTANEANWGNWGVNNWITIDIATLIQAIVDRAGWSANNALAVVMLDNGSTTNHYILARAYDYFGNAHGAKLDITFTEGSKTKNSRQAMNVHSGVLFQTLTSGHGY